MAGERQPDKGPEGGQLSFGFLRPGRTADDGRRAQATSPLSNNLFFAVLPDEADAVRIAGAARSIRSRHGLSAPVRPWHVLHISLYPLGRYAQLPAGLVGLARQAGAAVRHRPFDVSFNRVMSFRGARQHPLVLLCDEGSSELTGLRQSLGAAMASLNPVFTSRLSGLPHMTLLYDRQQITPAPLEEPLGFRAKEVVLVQSLVGRTRYVPLARWQLGAG